MLVNTAEHISNPTTFPLGTLLCLLANNLVNLLIIYMQGNYSRSRGPRASIEVPVLIQL